MDKINKIMELMDTISYGFLDSNGNNLYVNNQEKLDVNFINSYIIQSPKKLLQTKCGMCFEQVELERELFLKSNIEIKTYFIYIDDNQGRPSHTFLVFYDNNKIYWFEHSWARYKGIHEYSSLKVLLEDVKQKMRLEHNYTNLKDGLYIYEYDKPREGLTCEEFYSYAIKGKTVLKN